ncbi:hypothetical protein [Streptomyces sp. NPDC048473]|uniref:hypothetical protein n=1 Tax=unclassified Streptomyces TaxID=2593676 RepID=UPI003719CB25
MSGALCDARRPPTRPMHADQGRPQPSRAHAACADRTAPPATDAARTGAVHPVPKSFRSKERQS